MLEARIGVAAIEAFLLARFFMFQQVYFHKSTRAAEWMIGAILRRAVAQVRDGSRLPTLPIQEPRCPRPPSSAR